MRVCGDVVGCELCMIMLFCFFVYSDLISKHLDQYAGVLHRTGSLCRNFTLPTRLHCLLGNLVVQSLHHRDIVQSELPMLSKLMSICMLNRHIVCFTATGY